MLRTARRRSNTSRSPEAPASKLSGLLVNVATLPVLLVLGNACLCPPCAEAPTSAGAGNADNAPTAAVATAASGDELMIWDGDKAGASAQGWADCDDKPACKTKFGLTPGEGVDGSKGLLFHGQGKKWLGMGWNWFGWWPKDGGTDIRPYDTLKFSIRFVVASPKEAPEPAGMTVALRCSAGEKNSASVSLDKYLKNPGDGKWHEVEIPLAELYKGKEGKEFDPGTAWEMNLGTWASNERKFDIYLDNIRVSKK